MSIREDAKPRFAAQVERAGRGPEPDSERRPAAGRASGGAGPPLDGAYVRD